MGVHGREMGVGLKTMACLFEWMHELKLNRHVRRRRSQEYQGESLVVFAVGVRRCGWWRGVVVPWLPSRRWWRWW